MRKIVHQVVRLPGFYYDIVDVCLNGSPDVIPENVEHTSLVCRPGVSETEWHRHVAEHTEWRDEGGRELVGLLHLDLVETGVRIKEA